MKKWIAVILVVFCLSGCVSSEDKAISSAVKQEITDIGVVSLNKAEQIYNAKKNYDALSDKQKKLVTNSDVLSSSISKLKALEQEEKTKNDPTRSITKSDLTGIWKGHSSSSHTWYLYFSSRGEVYYLGIKTTPKSSDFTKEHLISSSFKLGEYDSSSQKKTGSFYCEPSRETFNFTVAKAKNGQMTLTILGSSVAAGPYTMTGIAVTEENQKCLHEGCTKWAVNSGDSYYCADHSNRCSLCNCYIDEDALLCLTCIINALK